MRLLFVVFACLIGLAIVPATGAAACTFQHSELTYAWTSSVKGLQLQSATAAAAAWSERTNVTLTATTSRRKADILLTVHNVQDRPLRRPAQDIGATVVRCTARSVSIRATVTFDTQWVRSQRSFNERRAMAGHELGHALGLGHTMVARGWCWAGVKRAASLMNPTLAVLPSGDLCGPAVPTKVDVKAMNALYN